MLAASEMDNLVKGQITMMKSKSFIEAGRDVEMVAIIIRQNRSISNYVYDELP